MTRPSTRLERFVYALTRDVPLGVLEGALEMATDDEVELANPELGAVARMFALLLNDDDGGKTDD